MGRGDPKLLHDQGRLTSLIVVGARKRRISGTTCADVAKGLGESFDEANLVSPGRRRVL
jgi:hypothetical protein